MIPQFVTLDGTLKRICYSEMAISKFDLPVLISEGRFSVPPTQVARL